jgi:hypothetical protein
MTDYHEAQLNACLEEYKVLSSDIQARVDLQHRNFNLFLVVASGFIGYAVDYSSKNGVASFQASQVALVLVIVPLVAQLFLWRHYDHDANIIDKALYIDTILRPRLAILSREEGALGFESFLRQERLRRPFRMGPVVILGSEVLGIATYCLLILAGAWYVRVDFRGRAGALGEVYDILLYLDSAMVALTVVTTIFASRRYTTLGLPTS